MLVNQPKSSVHSALHGLIHERIVQQILFYLKKEVFNCFNKTRRKFFLIIQEHKYKISIDNLKTPLGRHAAFHYYYKPFKVQFPTLDRVHIAQKGGDFDPRLLQVKTQWIYQLQNSANQVPITR